MSLRWLVLPSASRLQSFVECNSPSPLQVISPIVCLYFSTFLFLSIYHLHKFFSVLCAFMHFCAFGHISVCAVCLRVVCRDNLSLSSNFFLHFTSFLIFSSLLLWLFFFSFTYAFLLLFVCCHFCRHVIVYFF